VIVCLAANPSIDKLFEIERLVKGDIHRPASFLQVAGGKGLNVARAAAALGAEVTAVRCCAATSGSGSRSSCTPKGSPPRPSGRTARTDRRSRSPIARPAA